MTKEEVEKFIGKMVTDSEFKDSFFENPEGVLKEYDLTEEEHASLKTIKKEDVDKFGSSLDERISKWGGAFGGGI